MSNAAIDLSAAPEDRWSPYQRAVFAAIENPDAGHLLVEALAGSGKTTTSIEGMCRTRESQSVRAMAFNKSIASELAERVPEGVEVSTFHSYGLRAITRADGRREIDSDVCFKRVAGRLGRSWDTKEIRASIVKLVGAAKNTLAATHSELDAVADRMGIEIAEHDRDRAIEYALRILGDCRRDDVGPIDFDDMIWLPVARDLPLARTDWLFVDETQDLNPAQLEISCRAVHERGRIVAVGDRRQAIYGFRGADPHAIPRMIERLAAERLPLSICYRCPTLVLDEARRLVPEIENAPGAPEGIVRTSSVGALRESAVAGDFVISRTNAPLLSLAFHWIANGKRCAIKGRDIGAGLAAWIRNTRATTIAELRRCIESWHVAEHKRLGDLDRDTSSVDDKAACLRVLAAGHDSVEAVVARVERLFDDREDEGRITLSSTHRAKGLEFDRVWLLRDTYCKWPGEEERNLLYVAITRSKRELVFAHDEEP